MADGIGAPDPRTGPAKRSRRSSTSATTARGSMLLREVAEAVGKSNHFTYGDNERLPEHIVALGDEA